MTRPPDDKVNAANPAQPVEGAQRIVEPLIAAPRDRVNTPEIVAADQLYGSAPPADHLEREVLGSSMYETDATSASDANRTVKGTSLWRDAWRRLKKNKLAMVGGVVVITIVIAAIVGPFIIEMLTGYTYSYIPSERSLVRAFPPSLKHPFGTDPQGRDILARVLYGGRISLMVGLISTAVSLVIGISYGSFAGYMGGKIDNFMMRIVDVLFAIPYMMLVIVLLALFEKSLFLLFAALGAISWLTMARIVRGQVLSLKNQEFVEAARAIGVPTWKIILRHLVPNTLSPVIVYATLTIPSVMLQEAFLSYLGLGVQAPRSSWGTLAAEGAQNIAIFPWMIIFPGVVMALTLFSLNFLGDGLRDALDPQMRKD